MSVITMRVLITGEQGPCSSDVPAHSPAPRMDVYPPGSGATTTSYYVRKTIVNVNVLKHRLSRMNAALSAMGEPGVDCPPVVRAYVTGVRDALAGVLADTPEDQA